MIVFYFIPSIFINWNSIRKMTHLPHLCTHLFISAWTNVFSLFYDLQPNTLLFCCSDCFSFGHWELLCHFDMFPFFDYLFPDTTRCSRIILYFPYPVLKSTILLGALDSFIGKIFRNQDLDTRCYLFISCHNVTYKDW